MNEQYTDEDIKKAIEQADANLGLEEIDLLQFTQIEQGKVYRKELKNERRIRQNNVGRIFNSWD